MISFFRYIYWLLLVVFLGCGSDENQLFDIDMEADFTIAPGLNTFDTHYFILRDVPTRIQSYLQVNNSGAISEILPRRAEITAPFDNIDFAIVQEISIWAISSQDNTLKKEIFYQDRINLNEQKDLRLFSSLSEVKDIFLNDYVDLEVRLRFRAFTPTQIDSKLIMNFIVNGKE